MLVIILFIIFMFLFLLLCKNLYELYEHFTPAVLTQLFAKGPEDAYLTSGIDDHIPERHIGYIPWKYYMWFDRPIGDYLHDSHDQIMYSEDLPLYRK